MGLRPQDLVVAVKLALDSWQSYPALAGALKISQSEADAAVQRATAAGLLGPNRTANRAALFDFIKRSSRSAFPPQRGSITRGMPTAHAAPPLDQLVERGVDPVPVWPDLQGTGRGESFAPLYRSAPIAARSDPRLYAALSLIDAIRGGRPRDRSLAEEQLSKLLLANEDRDGLVQTTFSVSEPKRERILRSLERLIGPGTAAWYRSALDLLALERPIIATSHLIANLATDIESSLRDVLLEVKDPGREAEESRCDKCNHKIDGESQKTSILSILGWLGLPSDGSVGQAWLSLAGGKDPLHKRRHRSALAPPRPVDVALWEKFETVLDEVLDKFEAKYAKVFDALDKLAAIDSPRTADLKRLKGKLPQTQLAVSHFFRSVKSGSWIDPLDRDGRFAEPPAVEESTDGGTTHRPWHALEYLARFTTQQPETVARIALAVPLSDNSWVNRELARIALALPANLAAPFSEKVEHWLAVQPMLAASGLLGQVVDLAERLVQGREVGAALRVVEAVLTVSAADDDGSRTRLDEWEVRMAMGRIATLMVPLGQPALDVLSKHLAAAAAAHHWEYGDEWDDSSWSWRESIEEAAGNRDRGIAGHLVALTRDVAVRIVELNPAALPELVRNLEAQNWDIFRRLALYLLAQFCTQASALATPRLLDRVALSSHRVEHEYAQLLKRSFRSLLPEHQRELLSLIDAGPLREDQSVVPPMEEATWRLGRLKVIANDLPPEWRGRLVDLGSVLEGRTVEEYGSSSPPLRFAVGFKSPFEDGELLRMTPIELIERVQSWTPSTEFGAPDPGGLSRAVDRAVTAKPSEYASVASLLGTIDTTYLRGALDGFTAAVKAGRTFDWGPVMALCAWAMALPDQIPVRMDGCRGFDTRRRGLRASVLRLLHEGLTSSQRGIDRKLSAIAWSAIKPGLEDPDGIDDEESDRQGDLMQRSLSHIRPFATSVAIDYSLWLRSGAETSSLPAEVGAALDAIVTERSWSSRTVLGSRIGALVYLDDTWTRENVHTIFSSEGGRDPAWETYLEWGPFGLDVFQLLTWRYDLAINSWRSDGTLEEHDKKTARAIGTHLAGLYWNKRIGLTDRDQRLRRFLTNALPEVTGLFFKTIGRWLHEDQQIAPEILARLKTLWLDRDLVGHREEATSFSWWFSSGRFGEDWALDQFERALSAGGHLGFAPRVGEQLLELLPRHLSKVLVCLGRLISDREQSWAVITLRDVARTILGKALSSDDATEKRAAEEIVNRLTANDHPEFRDLLRQNALPAGITEHS